MNLIRLLVAVGWVGAASGSGTAAMVTIGVIGDYGSAASSALYAPMELAVANLVKSWHPDFLMTVGDNNYYYGLAETIDGNIGQFYHEFIHPYVGGYGAGAERNRFFPTLGNHDYWGAANAEPYMDYFTLPGNERYYNYRYGNVEIFALNSESPEPDGITPSSTQAQWLRAALAASRATWRLVYFHTAPYSSGMLHGAYGEGSHMRWPFKAWGATAVLAGHDHIYERLYTNGLTYFVNGTGGDRLDQTVLPPLPGSRASFTADWGAMRIDATETNLTFRFITRSNIVVDTHVIEDHPAALAGGFFGGQFQLWLTGETNGNYVMQTSTDLVLWTSMATNTAVTGNWLWSDPSPPSSGPRLYRALRAP